MTPWPPALRDDKSAPFFDAAARDELAIRRCRDCGQRLAPEAGACTACRGTDLEWTAATGEGRLVTWTVVERAPNPAFADVVPYTVGVVELAEGPWLYIRIEGNGRPPERDAPVRIEFVHDEDGDSYPICRLGDA